MWSNELAWIAQAYSQICQFERSDNVQSPSFSTVAFWPGNCSELHILHRWYLYTSRYYDCFLSLLNKCGMVTPYI